MPELAATAGTQADGVRRPDPQLGVFETLLVAGGRPVELDAHLDRLNASLTELFPSHGRPSLTEPIEAAADGVELGSIRIAVRPTGGSLREEVAVREFDPESNAAPAAATALDSFVLDGLGRHKWVDRSPIDAAQARLPADALPLIVDRDGAVLEASRANVFAVSGTTLATPPLDGRILPGVTRARVLELADRAGMAIDEREVSRGDLLDADEVFLTGSVRGIEPAGRLDGRQLSSRGRVSALLGAELRRTWIEARLG